LRRKSENQKITKIENQEIRNQKVAVTNNLQYEIDIIKEVFNARTIYHSIIVRCSIVRRSSFVVRRSSFVVRRSSFVVRRSSFVVRRSSFVSRSFRWAIF